MERCLPVNSHVGTWTLLAIVAALLALTPPVRSQPTVNSCKVVDAELQGNFVGGCVNGLAEGDGEASGTAHYKGSFKTGRKNGQGVKSWPSSGDRYEGEFLDDRKEGSGTYTWGPRSPWAGEKYTGSYLKDLRQGYGVYEWPSGDRYAGPWVNDIATGPATPAMMARARGHVETVAAVGKVGIKVCRQMTVGIGTRDWISGIVTAAASDAIAIRIIDTGQFEHVILNRPVTKGGLVLDGAQNWIPCY